MCQASKMFGRRKRPSYSLPACIGFQAGFLNGRWVETQIFPVWLPSSAWWAYAFPGWWALETTWSHSVPGPLPVQEVVVVWMTGTVLCSPAGLGARMHWWANGWRDRAQALGWQAACRRKGSLQQVGFWWVCRLQKDTWTQIATRDQLSCLDDPAATISQRMAFLNGRRNSGHSLGLVWPGKGWQFFFLWGF